MTSRRTLWLLSLALALVAPAAGGDEPVANRPCLEDAKRLCPGVEPGSPAIGACLRDHKDSLSDACRASMEKARSRLRGVMESCGDDLKEHCSGVERGGGGVLRCLRAHESELTPACRGAIGAAPESS